MTGITDEMTEDTLIEKYVLEKTDGEDVEDMRIEEYLMIIPDILIPDRQDSDKRTESIKLK